MGRAEVESDNYILNEQWQNENRQGDPRPPMLMLFVIAMEVLNMRFDKAQVDGVLQPIGPPAIQPIGPPAIKHQCSMLPHMRSKMRWL